MKPDGKWLAALALMLVLPATAMATEAYVIANVSLRAGPDIGYPRIDVLPAGARVEIQGCTADWGWCDVVYYDQRGWIAGNYMEHQYNRQPVLVGSYGSQIGIPIISFVIGAYWGSHYVNRPFYRERERWYRRPIPHRPPPPPPRNRWHPGDGRYPPPRSEPAHRATPAPGYRQPTIRTPPRPGALPASPRPPVQQRDENRQRVQSRPAPNRVETHATPRHRPTATPQPQRSRDENRTRNSRGQTPARGKEVKKEKGDQGH